MRWLALTVNRPHASTWPHVRFQHSHSDATSNRPHAGCGERRDREERCDERINKAILSLSMSTAVSVRS
jgi:hypothetical protein